MTCQIRRSLRPRILLYFASLLILSTSALSQANEWTWQTGSSMFPTTCNYSNSYCAQPGVYGTQGTPAAGNTPGSRAGAASSTDSQGNLWLFGGSNLWLGGSGNDLWKFDVSLKEWEWVSGSSTNAATGNWGTLGVPADTNVPSGRQNAVSWVDSSGNYWMFGGSGLDSQGNVGLLNDLWEYTLSTKQWTWVAGNNVMSCTIVFQKNVCVQPASNSGTLGEFSASNTPGGRSGEVTWKDSLGNFWLFGGSSYDNNDVGGNFNDFWEFKPTQNQWAWMGGVTAITCVNYPPQGFCIGSESPQPQYGTLGVAAAGNNPGGRDQAVGWIDSNGDLWIFGGLNPIYTAPLNDFLANFDDVWKFSFSSSQWTWMAGNNSAATSTSNFPGVYGTLGKAAAANVPGSRVNQTSWTDSSGNFWLFGGLGYDSALTNGYLNDLWEFNPSSQQWRWMGGSPTVGAVCAFGYCGQPGSYGTLGTAAEGNVPGGRAEAAGWTDLSGNFWLFGGGIEPVQIFFNDLWEYHPSANTLPAAILPALNPPAGTYLAAQSVAISNGMANASIYYTTNGSTPTSTSTLYSVPVSVSANETIQAIAIASGYPNSGVATAAYAITPPTAAPTFSELGGTFTGTQTVSLSDTTPNATIYYTTDGSTSTTASTVYTGAITVSLTETIQAIASATGYVPSAVASATYTITPDFSLAAISPSTVTVVHGNNGSATVSVTPLYGFSSTVSFACSGLPAGASCSFSPSTVTPSGGAASTTLTISTASARASLLYYQIPGLALMLMLCGFGWGGKGKREGKLRTRSRLTACILGLILLAGCGGSSNNFTQITSTVTVTASSGSSQHTATLTLIIN